ncbi:MAG: hypothetical protein A2908_03895 [Candidatus Staskawiczbacteria bacterium RIFCSPLOWO2_01_FULL_38_12b]|uniref:Uncharacterized protein n=1 Tax=Candidatus Staskawiczbacteria bacterium RIFCSPLOWO2_01_FULL_38_12b TaxID=1802214 RepID=A0A1G2IC30_9BACT|nr:MAG: hypothetical protein A2908_03895 [Candidatus Staskawiczbacteria bacterium RIFCSPLOWO2_01_FULL_38_12b]
MVIAIPASPIFWANIVLLVATALFYAVLFSLVYYWHEKKATFIVVPLLYTFEFFITGFFLVSFLVILLQYLPDIVKLTTLNYEMIRSYL